MHPSPDVLALLALGEKAGTAEERIHVDSCPVCLAEVAEFVRVAAVGRSATGADQLQAPPPEVWRAVRSELGLSGDTAALSSSVPASDVSEGQGVSDGPGVSDSPGASDGRMQDVPRDVRQPAMEGSPPDSAASAVSSAAVPDSGRRRGSRGRRVLSLTLAAAIALVVGFGLGFLVDRFVQPTQTVIERAQLQALPAWPGARGEAWVERDGTGDRFLEVRVDSSRPDPGYSTSPTTWTSTSSPSSTSRPSPPTTRIRPTQATPSSEASWPRDRGHVHQTRSYERSGVLCRRGGWPALAGGRRPGFGESRRRRRRVTGADRSGTGDAEPAHEGGCGGVRPGPGHHACGRCGGVRCATGRLAWGRLHRTSAVEHAADTDVGPLLCRAAAAPLRAARSSSRQSESEWRRPD